MKNHLIHHHKAMEKLCRSAAESMDDGHEAKTFLSQAADHHAALHKALAGDELPSVGNEGWRGRGGDLDGPKARKVFASAAPPASHRLVPRTGMEDLVESTKVSPEMEDALGGL